MAGPKFVNEREVRLVDLEPTRGIELQKVRPSLVLRKFSREHFVVLPLTTNQQAQNSLKLKGDFLHKVSFVKIDQIRVVDIARFQNRFGKISNDEFLRIKKYATEVLRLLPRGLVAKSEPKAGSNEGTNVQNTNSF